jgi:hypothetical protein
VTEVGRRYLDAIGECLDLEPESAHEVMAELENHFVEEAAHNANDPQDVAERRVISRLGSPRSLAARLNRGPRARRAGDPVISLWLSFDTYRRWRKAMAAIVAIELYTLVLLALSATWRSGFFTLGYAGAALSYFVFRWLTLWTFDHLKREEVGRVATAMLFVGAAGYIVGIVVLFYRFWSLNRWPVVVWIVALAFGTFVSAIRLAKAKQWRPKPSSRVAS